MVYCFDNENCLLIITNKKVVERKKERVRVRVFINSDESDF